METETEEEYLQFPCDESSGSLSSSISLSDKSVSTDNHVEEFVGDVPFAGKNSNLIFFNVFCLNCQICFVIADAFLI